MRAEGITMMLSVGKAARLLGVTPATTRRWTEIGLLPCTRTAGGHRRIARDDVLELARAIGGSSQMAVRQAREHELETLVEASLAVAEQLDQSVLMAEIAKQVTRLCRCHTCSISSFDSGAGTVTVLAEYDARGRRTSATGTFDLSEYPETLRRMREQVPGVINVDDPRVDPAERALLKRFGDLSTLEIPLIFQGRTVGLLEAIDRERSRTYSRQELRLVSALAGQAAVALRNAELFQAAHQADTAVRSVRDRMTAVASAVAQVDPQEAALPSLSAVAAALCDAFAARSAMITLDGEVVGAASGPAAPGAEAGDVPDAASETAHVLSRAVDGAGGRLEVTLVLSEPATPEDGDLLDVSTSFAGLLAPGRSRPVSSSRKTV
jgi:excisionase family DNA binding protein